MSVVGPIKAVRFFHKVVEIKGKIKVNISKIVNE